jgi:hypothetical protein
MKITVLLLIASVSINPGNSTQKPAETSSEQFIKEEIVTAEIARNYEKHPAFAVIRNCN